MSVYVNTFTTSLIVFIVTSALLTMPIVIYQYRKNGFFNLKKIIVIYSFIFYIQTVFLLVILPLPSLPQKIDPNYNIWKHINFVPFSFVEDILNKAKPLSITSIIRSNDFYTTAFNVLMTIPLGYYFRGLFHFSFKKAVLLGFLISLFFEITQLTGLFFIYPQPYRYFEVNDLITNTFGTAFGYITAPILGFLFISKEQEQVQRLKTTMSKVTIFPQMLIIFMDILIFEIIYGFVLGAVSLTYYFLTQYDPVVFKFNEIFLGSLHLYSKISVFIILFLLYPLNKLNQTMSMKVLKYSISVSNKGALLFRNAILYACFAFNTTRPFIVIYYVVLLVFRRKSNFLDRILNIEYRKLL